MADPSCPRCHGTGKYLMARNAHESEGWVPCECNYVTPLRAQLAPPEPLPEGVEALIQEAQAAYAAVALFPEREPHGLNKLLALRNMIPPLVAALADRQRAVAAEREKAKVQMLEFAQRWRNDAFEAAAQIAERYDAPQVRSDILAHVRARGAAQEEG